MTTRELTPDAKGKRVWPCDVRLPTELWRWETGCWGSLDGRAVGDGGGCLVSEASAGFLGVDEFWARGRRTMGKVQRRVRRIRLGLSPSSVPVPVQSRSIGNRAVRRRQLVRSHPHEERVRRNGRSRRVLMYIVYGVPLVVESSVSGAGWVLSAVLVAGGGLLGRKRRG